jgi:phosphate transport system protein
MRPEHTDRQYEEQLRALRRELLEMGKLVEKRIGEAVRGLIERDAEVARAVIEGDREIDQMEIRIDDHCVQILARRQPVASDLRTVATGLKLVTDLERIGDLAVHIAERAIELIEEPPLKPYVDLPNMAETAQAMVREALEAFVTADAERAERILAQDDVVDAYYWQIFRELLTYMLEDPRNISRAMRLQSIAKHLERVGDHATNLAEMVVFMVKGKDIRHSHPPATVPIKSPS